MKILERYTRVGVLAHQASFRPETAEYATDRAGPRIDVAQQVPIFSKAEIIDVVRWYGDLPYCSERGGFIRTVQADHAGAANRGPTRQLLDSLAEFQRLLKEEGLEEIPASPGLVYSHEKHEAVETAEEGEDGTILAVLQKGYTFQGSLFRPARVKISKKAGPVAAAEKSADDAPAI